MTPGGRSRHVLYVAWGFPPHRGPGVYRPLATVSELVRRGHQVTVLTADLDTFRLAVGGDEGLLARVPASVRVLRVPVPHDLREPFINRWPRARIEAGKRWTTRTTADHLNAFPEQVYAPWGPRARSTALALHLETPVDLCLATGNPYVDFTVPLALNAEHDVPFVLDDRDSWILDVYTGGTSPLAEQIRPWLADALATTRQMWFVNPPIADWHRREFPEHAAKIRVVENGWDPAFLRPDEFGATPADRPLAVSFIGTISPRLPLQLIVDAWRVARREPALAAAELRMVGQFGHGAGTTAEQARILADSAADGITFTGRVPKAEIGTAYRRADVLLFAKEGAGMVTSGKVYEYVATGRPIASVLEAEHDARRVLAGYPRWHDAGEVTASGLASALVAAAEDARSGGDRRPAALAHGARFRRDTVLAGALDDLETELGW